MIKVTLYNSLPSDTWAFAYRVPWTDVIGLVAGLKTRGTAEQAVSYIGEQLAAPIEYCK